MFEGVGFRLPRLVVLGDATDAFGHVFIPPRHFGHHLQQLLTNLLLPADRKGHFGLVLTRGEPGVFWNLGWVDGRIVLEERQEMRMFIDIIRELVPVLFDRLQEWLKRVVKVLQALL